MHHDRVISKDELCTAIWPDQFIHDATLGSTVRAARNAVGDTGNSQGVIQTRHGHGYRLIAEVKIFSDIPSEPVSDDPLAKSSTETDVEAIAPVSPGFSPSPSSIKTEQATILLVDDEITIIKRLEALLTPRNLAAPGSAVPRGEVPLADRMIDEIDHELTRILTFGVDPSARCPAETALTGTPLLEETSAALQWLGNLIFSY